MTANPPLSRRRLLAAATAGVGAAQLATAMPVLAATAIPPDATLTRLLLAASAELRCPEAIRDSCRRALPAADGTPEILPALVLADLVSAGRDCTTPAAMRRALRAQSRDDFAAGRTIHVDGWMLSLTETRVYALGGYSCVAISESDADTARRRPPPASAAARPLLG